MSCVLSLYYRSCMKESLYCLFIYLFVMAIGSKEKLDKCAISCFYYL